MPANFENSSMATGLEKVSFHSNPKEEQCQRMFKLPHNCTHFTCQQGHAQNPPIQASTVRESKTVKCLSWIQKRQSNQRSNCNTRWIIEKAREFQKKKNYFCFIGFPDSSVGRESTCNAGDSGSISGLGRSPGEENGHPLQYSGLENSMDSKVHGVAKSKTQLSNFHFHFSASLTSLKPLTV